MHQNHGEECPTEEVVVMHPGSWCSEATLWTEWVHVGKLTAERYSEVLALDAANFVATTQAHRDVFRSSAEYSVKFVAQLNDQARKGELTDLPVLDESFSYLLPRSDLERKGKFASFLNAWRDA